MSYGLERDGVTPPADVATKAGADSRHPLVIVAVRLAASEDAHDLVVSFDVDSLDFGDLSSWGAGFRSAGIGISAHVREHYPHINPND